MTFLRDWAAFALAALLLTACQSSPKGEETNTAPATTTATSGSSATPALPAMPPAGGGDAKLLAEAMQKATGWHVRSVWGSGVVEEIDVVCPDRQKITRKNNSGVTTLETVQIGDTVYAKTGQAWVQSSPRGLPRVCGPEGAASSPAPSRMGEVTKGGLATVNGESCQEWTIALPDLGSSMTTCLGSDNLPRQTKFGATTIIFSAWNEPATIEAPQ